MHSLEGIKEQKKLTQSHHHGPAILNAVGDEVLPCSPMVILFSQFHLVIAGIMATGSCELFCFVCMAHHIFHFLSFGFLRNYIPTQCGLSGPDYPRLPLPSTSIEPDPFRRKQGVLLNLPGVTGLKIYMEN